jgi:predicted nucleic acid-binding protein
MPEEARLVVVNTTPIIALSLIGELDLLRLLYGQVLVPPSVEAEVLAGGRGGTGRSELQEAAWLRIVSLQDPSRADLLADLDRGEAEVIALAQELNADLAIIDERLARRHARRLGLTLTGTLGVLLKAKQLGYVKFVAPLVDQLRQDGIRLSDVVVAEVLALADER